MTAEEPLIDKLECSVYTVPTDQPEADGTATWSATTCLVVHAGAGGQTGLGYTYGPAACAGIVADSLHEVVGGRPAFAVVGSWGAMVRGCRKCRPARECLDGHFGGRHGIVGSRRPAGRPAARRPARAGPRQGAGLRQQWIHHLRRCGSAPAARALGERPRRNGGEDQGWRILGACR